MRSQKVVCALATALLLLAVLMTLDPALGRQSAFTRLVTRPTRLSLVLAARQAWAATSAPLPQPAVDYHKDIVPLFKASCASCHSADAHSSGFVVDTPQSLLKGGSKFGAKDIVKGDAAGSALMAYLRGQMQPQMPVGAPPLSAAKIQMVADWINGGAKTDTAPESTDATATGQVSFHGDVEPILKASCASCHSADAHSSGFVVDTPQSLLKGGALNGARDIVPGNAADSVLVAYLNGRKKPQMPLGKAALTEPQIKTITAWIDQGAKIDTIKLGWPYTPPSAAPIPPVRNKVWVRNPIDNFVLAKLEARGLTPSPQASRVALVRRVYVDVVGVLPTPTEADRFLSDTSPAAYAKLVDRLLADPRYGERWGRHWLDLVRYADTNGFEVDGIRPHAWRYRDYVIQSLNQDKPYDRFLKEQIAGDELYPNDPAATVATGYARLGPWDELSGDPDQRWQDYLNDVTDTTGSALLGLTVGCARCHDHKYDQIKQADYYRLQAFFAGTKWVDTAIPEGNIPPEIAQDRTKLQSLKPQAQTLHDKYRALALAQKQKAAAPGAKVDVSDNDINAILSRPENGTDKKLSDSLQSQISDLENTVAPYEPVTEAVTDGGKTAPAQHILLRGNRLTPGPIVQPGFMASLVGGQERPALITPPSGGKTTGRRSALANWLGSRQNPMTARVIVNRLWQFHFGRGIVGTPSDFGKNGDGATHPELLDWLAVRFMNDGWSLKKMHRLMLLSATYRQASALNPRAARADPGNTLFWRMNPMRMDAEALRDSILTVSRRLNPQPGGPGVYPKVSDEVLSTGSTHKWGSSPEDQQRRRTVYVFQRRSLVLPIVEAFDGADMNNTCPRRSVTTIAPQALALFNGEFGRTESRFFAERVAREAGDDPDKQIVHAYQIALCRRPTAAQIAVARKFLALKTQIHLGGAAPALQTTALTSGRDVSDAMTKEAQMAALADFCHVLINTNEFIYLD